MASPITDYFEAMRDTFRSALMALRITVKYASHNPAFASYPRKPLHLPPRSRGIHEFEAEKCTACGDCVSACPVDCIAMQSKEEAQLSRFTIDYGKCMFCALCVDACPTQCLHMGRVYDMSVYRREDTVVDFVALQARGQRTPIPIWMDRNADRIAWIRSERERIQAGKLANKA